jgi:hypothetical protein
MHGEGVGLGRRHAREQLAVHEQAPYLLERDPADELLDIHPAIAERSAGAVRLRDLGRKRDDALKA